MNKKILMICYYFPPLIDVGAKRSIAFAKYFRKYNWEPYVLSVKNPDKTYCSVGNDESPAGVCVDYSSSLFNLGWLSSQFNGLFSKAAKLLGRKQWINYFEQFFCVPDIFLGWIPLTFFKALKILKSNQIDTIYVSCTPYTSAIIGMILKKVTGKKLIIDFRDRTGVEDQELKVKKYPLKVRRKFEEYWLKKALQMTDYFIVTSQELKSNFIKLHPFVENKIHKIYNGFDLDFLPSSDEKVKNKKFTIIYTGDFYEYYIKPFIFFEALSLLQKDTEIDSSNFQFLFFGESWQEINGYAEKYGVQKLVIAKERIPFKDVLKEINSAQIQLIRIIKPMISTKIFEGIPLNIPFLATIPAGEVEQLITTYSPSSIVVTEEDARKIADAILQIRKMYRQGKIVDNNIDEYLKLFSRENQTKKLMSIIGD